MEAAWLKSMDMTDILNDAGEWNTFRGADVIGGLAAARSTEKFPSYYFQIGYKCTAGKIV